MTNLLPVPAIGIGAGRLDGLGDDVRALFDRPTGVLLVVDPGLRVSGAGERAATALASRSLRPVLFEAFGGEPTAAQIDAAAALARDQRAEVIVGIGGGSALDIAKMVAAISPGELGADHYQLCANPFPPAPLPLIQVPTTAGTGSEATITAVHTNADGRKVWCWGSEIAARKIILDVDLVASLPTPLMAATGLDALVHAVEAVTNRNATPFSRLHGHAAIRLIAEHLEPAVAGRDRSHREHMLWASCLAGTAINNAGTAIGHTVAHALGSLGKIHHGRAAALGLRASLPWSITHNREAYAIAAEAMGGPRDAEALPGLVDGLIRRVGLDVAIGRERPDITPARLAEEMARPEHVAMRNSHAKPSTDEDLRQIAEAVLSAS